MDIVKAIADAGRRCWRLFSPDMPIEQRRELANSPTWNAQEREKVVAKAREQNALQHRESDMVAKALAGTEHKAVDGLGEKVGSIPYLTYMQMRVDHGDDCWSDPGFIAAFFRDNPQLRVKTNYGTHGQEYAGNGRRR